MSFFSEMTNLYTSHEWWY